MTRIPRFSSSVSLPNRIIAIIILLGLVILANAFAAYYVGKEHYIYYWDWAGYWMRYMDISALILQHPLAALRSVLSSVRNDDYNLLPALPLIPFNWLFGSGRQIYILAITNVSLLSGALMLGVLAQRLLPGQELRPSFTPLVLTTASTLLLASLWGPVLRGLPDVLGISVIGAILLIHFSTPPGQSHEESLDNGA